MPLIALTILSFFYLTTFVRFRPRLAVDESVSQRFQVRIIHNPIISMNDLKLVVLPKSDAVPGGVITYTVTGLGGKVTEHGVIAQFTPEPPNPSAAAARREAARLGVSEFTFLGMFTPFSDKVRLLRLAGGEAWTVYVHVDSFWTTLIPFGGKVTLHWESS
jgi:hypothetical protein